MVPELALTRSELKLYELNEFDQFNHQPSTPTTPNQWFVKLYPEAYENHGSPFLELEEQIDQFSSQVLPITINHDFFASCLGGRKDLNHHVIYFEPEMQWYFQDSDQIFKPTTAEKLMTQFRALMMKCAEEMPGQVHKLNLVHEFRQDKTAKLIIQRAKSILAADQSFFSATSSHQRIRGLELVERVARRFVDEVLTNEPGQILTLNEALAVFRLLLKEKNMPDIKRSDFRAVMVPLVREQFNVALRNDLRSGGGRGWKGVKMLQSSPN